MRRSEVEAAAEWLGLPELTWVAQRDTLADAVRACDSLAGVVVRESARACSYSSSSQVL